jgi:histidinol-phosphate aminotransferase
MPVKLVRQTEATLVFLPSPNNPTGNYLPLEDVRRICGERCILVLDEAYADFTEQPSADSLVANTPNLIVTRTFSKWAGLAGLRVGYALADQRLIEKMLAIKQPYNVNAAGRCTCVCVCNVWGLR